MISKEKLRASIHTIMHRHDLNHEEFGRSIGISKMMVSYVLSGKRNLRLKNVQKFCDVWGIEIESLLDSKKKSGLNISQVINEILRIRKLQVDDLVDITGFDVLTLSQLKRGLREPTQEEWEKLSAVLGVEFEIIDEGKIISAFQIIQEQMDGIGICDEAIEAVMRFLEREMQNRRPG